MFGNTIPGLEEYAHKMRLTFRHATRSHPTALFGNLTGRKDSRLSRITVSVAMGQLLAQLF
ncbi:MAG: hypothetical protein F6J94_23685 [Moorea sp. SIO1F2]|uniref:hypothetical protein n=1 Tax=unclassified Moorena TaxID=2683338 RepID=UPI0013B72E9E|nr:MULTISPECIES: hypothetical protein [unclassified Moorena]NEN96841.1 hypothetical protein [Moorena sp. SIO3I7]NEO51602.1 hypothetical protein [Moorena sp. SIO4A3]NEO05094.1 hypothetical protein [Moorena sp. SIO3I8]NEO18353.1 hypothetical protein [Moorena sp. SIO4A5]NEP26319.1 hypothetical protein [Moorena sp. SIO3I6]